VAPEEAVVVAEAPGAVAALEAAEAAGVALVEEAAGEVEPDRYLFE
jgi:hypothetical protein